MIYFFVFCNFILTHFSLAEPRDMLAHVKQLQKDLPKGKILVVTLVFTAALLTVAVSMIKKTYQEERKSPPSGLSKSQLRSYLVKAGMAARNEFVKTPAEAIKTVLETYARQRNLTWKEKGIAEFTEISLPVEFQVGSDTIIISFLERENEMFMKIEAVCGKQGALVVIAEHGLIKSAVYNVG